jgi:DNA modification methylase
MLLGCAPISTKIHRVLKPGSYCVSFYGRNRVEQFAAAWNAAGFRIVGHLVFRKAYASGGKLLHYTHECAYLLAKRRRHAAEQAHRRRHRLEIHRQQTPPNTETRKLAATAY